MKGYVEEGKEEEREVEKEIAALNKLLAEKEEKLRKYENELKNMQAGNKKSRPKKTARTKDVKSRSRIKKEDKA